MGLLHFIARTSRARLASCKFLKGWLFFLSLLLLLLLSPLLVADGWVVGEMGVADTGKSDVPVCRVGHVNRDTVDASGVKALQTGEEEWYVQ